MSDEVKPCAWRFELANLRYSDGTYDDWSKPIVSLIEPSVPEGAIRNLTPLYPRPSTPLQPSEPIRGDEPSSNVPVSASPAADGWMAKARARIPAYYPDFVDDAEGLARWRGMSAYGDGHDPSDANKNTVQRFVQTIDRLQLALRLAAGQSLTEASEDGSSQKNTVLHPPEGKVQEASRYHLTEPTVLLKTAEGDKSFGAGWLLISEDEYATLTGANERLARLGRVVERERDEALDRAETAEAERDKLAAEVERYREGWESAQAEWRQIKTVYAEFCADLGCSSAQEVADRLQTAEANLSSEAKAHEVTKGKLAGLTEDKIIEVLAVAQKDMMRERVKMGFRETDWRPLRPEEIARAILAALDQPSVEGERT